MTKEREALKPTQVPEQLAKYVAALMQGTHEITSVTIRPKREWVGLTVEQIEDVGFNLLPTVTRKDFVAFARYVEMLSKELNT